MIVAASFDVKNPELWLNRGLSYGDGLFETMHLTSQGIPLLEFHLERLNQALNYLKMDSFNRTHIDDFVAKRAEVDGLRDYLGSAVVKLIVYRGRQDRTYRPLTRETDWLITVDQLPDLLSTQPLRLALAEQKIAQQPALAGIKHLSRLEQVLLASELNSYKDIDDLLVTDAKDQIIETTYQNVVFIKNNQLITPKLNNSGVNGVALQWLKNHFDVRICAVNIQDMVDYDGLMVCNSIRGFRSVDSLRLNANELLTFGKSHDIHDKISAHWALLFKV